MAKKWTKEEEQKLIEILKDKDIKSLNDEQKKEIGEMFKRTFSAVKSKYLKLEKINISNQDNPIELENIDIVEEPKVEEVKTEEPKVEEVKTEEPKVEEVKAEEPKVEEVKAEEPKVEESCPKIKMLFKIIKDFFTK